MPGRYGTTRADFYNQMGDNLRGSSMNVAQALLQKQLQDKQMEKEVAIKEQLLNTQGKHELDAAIKKAIVEGVAGGKLKPKLGQTISTQDLISGKVPDLNQFDILPQHPTVSITQTERPYTEMLKAREIAARTPAEYGKAGMASKTGGWFGNWGPGSQWKLSPEAVAEQAEAHKIMSSPNKRTIRGLGYGSTQGDQISESQLPDPSEYEEGTVIEYENGQQYIKQQGQWVSQ